MLRSVHQTLIVAILLASGGCETLPYLDPSGQGVARTRPGLCPVPYRVLVVDIPNSDARIYINAFRAGEYTSEATMFEVVSDRPVFYYQLIHPEPRPEKHTREVSFPDGKAIHVSSGDGRSVSGEAITVSDGAGGTSVVLKFPLPEGSWESFTATFPAVSVDGQRVTIGKVTFKPGKATIYGINC